LHYRLRRGWRHAAKILTEGGLNCVLLEAGPNVVPEKDFKMLMWPYEAPHVARAWAGTHAKISESSSRRTGPGRLMASLILRRRAQISVVSFAHRRRPY